MAEQNDTKQLLIIDGTAFVYRAFYGMQQQLTNSQGQPTAAVLSFTRTLLKLLEDGNEYIAICFDRGGKSKRDELYAAYKADRPPTPDALVSPIPIRAEDRRGAWHPDRGNGRI